MRQILVVDDDADLRETLCTLLTDEGYCAIGAQDGAEALAWLRGAMPNPCVILLDLMMPGMNGWQFRDEQLRDPRLAGIPTLVITASRHVDDPPLRSATILHKPIQVAALLDAVRRHCAVTD